ncbi:hypothetical protein KJ786_03140 [Patescibacteria group bacterium]|nr:hypothetical protein [Patescibacteria group bacterium]
MDSIFVVLAFSLGNPWLNGAFAHKHILIIANQQALSSQAIGKKYKYAGEYT